jgi:uncharacterized protein (DUF302 family)
MPQHFSKTISSTFEDVLSRTKDGLEREGFGVLTDIDFSATLKEQLDVNFQNYRILGACNPSLAYQALKANKKIGAMLPCNIIVQERAEGYIEVSTVDPAETLNIVGNPDLAAITEEVRSRLKSVVKGL